MLAAAAPMLLAGPELDLSNAILVDGFSNDFRSDEDVFGPNNSFLNDGRPCTVQPDSVRCPCTLGNCVEPICPCEESDRDSRWGFFNDVNQIHLTWDALFLYVAVDGITWDNNLMLFLDITRRNRGVSDGGKGLTSLVEVNAWRRNISFANDFEPDLFLATWDQNDTQTPQLWEYRRPNQVVQVPPAVFSTVATFAGNAEGRAMEAAIPWSVLLQSDSTIVSAAYGDTVPVIPAGFDTLRLVACVTAGPDGTGSPDAAPDNFSGFQIDSLSPATLDNFVIVPLDLLDANGAAAPDRIPDMARGGFTVSVRDRVTFFARPPIEGIAFSLTDVHIQRGVVSPEEGYELEFELDLEPDLDPQQLEGRTVEISAEVYDLRGVRRRTLFDKRRVPADGINDPLRNRWNGRDDAGSPVEGGLYILRVVLEPGLGQAQRSFAVIR